MQIKKFEAQNMTEALRMIKKEFGPDAVILSADSITKKRALWGGMKHVGVEVTAATDRIYQKMGAGRSADLRFQDVGGAVRSPETASQGFKDVGFRRYGKDQASAKSSKSNKRNYQLYRQMVSQGVEKHLALNLVNRLTPWTSSAEMIDIRDLKANLVDILTDMGLAAEPIRLEEGRKKIVVLVGPSGVGKTTTLAKIAAEVRIKSRLDRVAILTMDHFRIGGIAQLKTYADIFDLPFETASNRRELVAALKRLRQQDLILVDTAGISQSDRHSIEDLKHMFERIRPLEFHLLMSATTKDQDLETIVEKFEALPIARLAFTKLDESSTYGSLLNMMARSLIPVSYFADGQQVPGNLEAAALDKLADLIVEQGSRNDILKDPPEMLAQKMVAFEKRLDDLNVGPGGAAPAEQLDSFKPPDNHRSYDRRAQYI